MKTISCTDVIFATVTRFGRPVASLCLSGITSINEILSRIRRTLSDTSGLITLNLRNSTQGWTSSQNYRFA